MGQKQPMLFSDTSYEYLPGNIASLLAIYQDDFAPQCFFRIISLWGF